MTRKTLYAVVLAWMLAATAFAQTDSLGRKRVAVVLSGGGAKGMAHIGALKVIERAGIPVDIVTGTSMGSIIGGLYAIGYNADLLDSIVRQQDWLFVLSDKEDLSHQSLMERQKQNTYQLTRAMMLGKKDVADGGIIKGKNLATLFQRLTAGYNDPTDFSKLPIPFACVATNIVDNSEHDFHDGRLAQAMRASMAIPAVFAPVKVGDKVLVDGGLRNNYPADLAREMGADIIIGVTVQGEPRTADDLGSTASILGQIVDVNCKNKYDDNLAITDVPIRVNTKGYGAASFTKVAIDTLIRRGEEAAMQHWDDLKALKQRIGIGDDYKPKKLTPRGQAEPDRVKILALEFEGLTPVDQHFIRQKFGLDVGDSIDQARAEQVTTSMRVDLFYKDATSRFFHRPGGARVVFTASEKKTTQLSLGVRFDTEEMVALQLNSDIPIRSSLPMDLDLTLRLGRRIMARADFSLHPMNFTKPSVTYMFRRNDINVYEDGNKDYNITYNQHTAELALLNLDLPNINLTLGGRWDYINYSGVLIDHEVERTYEPIDDGHYLSYFGRMICNTENDWYFPERGMRLLAKYAYHTDNFVRMNGKLGLSEVSASWRASFTLGKRFTLQPMVYGRLLFGSECPILHNNLIGGPMFSHYVEQQMPFAGVGHVERTDPHFVGFQLQAQQRIGGSHYVQLRLAGAQHSSQLKQLLDHRTMLGGSLCYYYNTILGPLGAEAGYSNKTKKAYFYINLGFEF
jgi:NTE family protein